ncbi:MAG: aminodeoxychorismate synthase, component I, partial [Marinilabiliales bacterium]
MRKEIKIEEINLSEFKNKVLQYGRNFKDFIFLDSNHFTNANEKFTYYDYDFLAAIDSLHNIYNIKDLESHCSENKDWLFGYLSYDLKNEIEELESNNIDELHFSTIHFFIPHIIIYSRKSKVSVIYNDKNETEQNVLEIIKTINNSDFKKFKKQPSLILNQRFSKKEYIETVQKLKNHIQRGDIYEVNFCQEFFSISEIDPIETFLKLNSISPAPFSCFLKMKDKYLISASPERFIKKNKSKIISQPIKGTIRRGENPDEDIWLKEQLYNDLKERAENVMIVDLVRNDLSRTAQKGTVKVEELYGIYSFTQVHQMISTVVSEINNKTNIIEVIKNAFPMGSMTGAPKIRAMQLIEEYEKTKRGLYSGSVGFITPQNDFDFNVVIRSILYNESKKYVSYTVGGAITSLSEPEKEYEECMVKA